MIRNFSNLFPRSPSLTFSLEPGCIKPWTVRTNMLARVRPAPLVAAGLLGPIGAGAMSLCEAQTQSGKGKSMQLHRTTAAAAALSAGALSAGASCVLMTHYAAPSAAGIAFATALASVGQALNIIRINNVLLRWLPVHSRHPGVMSNHPKLAIASRSAALALHQSKSTLAPMMSSIFGPRMASAAFMIESVQKMKSNNRLGRRVAVRCIQELQR